MVVNNQVRGSQLECDRDIDGPCTAAHPVASQRDGQAIGRWKYIAIFYTIACGFSWILWAPAVLGQDGLRWLHIAPSFPVIACLGTLGPVLACFITHRVETGNWRAVRLFPKPASRMLWLFLGPLLILFCFFGVFASLISRGNPMTWHWHLSAFAGILVPMFNYNLFGGPLFEEFGWRGFLQTRLQKAMPPWIAAVCVATMWAAWHLPLFLVHGWTSASPLNFLLILTGLSMIMALAFNASGGSVMVAILMHSTFNSSPRCLPGFLGSTTLREQPSGELLIAISFLLVGTTAVALTHGRLSRGVQKERTA